MSEIYEQMEIDITLTSERDLKENTAKMIKFAYDQMIQEEAPTKVKNKHEGYGITAEAYVNLASKVKNIKGDMDTFLKLLSSSESDTINVCGALYNSAAETAVKAIRMAAECQRIMNDLYYGESKTPLEQAFDELEKQDDGFEETEEADLNELDPEEESNDTDQPDGDEESANEEE